MTKHLFRVKITVVYDKKKLYRTFLLTATNSTVLSLVLSELCRKSSVFVVFIDRFFLFFRIIFIIAGCDVLSRFISIYFYELQRTMHLALPQLFTSQPMTYYIALLHSCWLRNKVNFLITTINCNYISMLFGN